MSSDTSTSWILWERDPESAAALRARAEAAQAMWQRTRTAAGRAAGARRGFGEPSRGTAAVLDPDAAPAHPHAPQARPAREQPTGTTEHGDLITEIIESRLVEIEFQPIVDVVNKQIVGFEALSRGPVDTPLRTPDQLFAAARAVGRAGELDWICRATAFREMMDRGLPGSISLFVNVGADSLIVECPENLLPTIWEASRKLRVFIELTGETMGRHPLQVLETVRRARAAHWGVSLGEIEFSSASLAMLPMIEPDVVKIDNRLLTSGLAYAGTALTAAMGEIEATGAALLVENIEDVTGYTLGRTVGGLYQRGYFHGRPGPLPDGLSNPTAPIRMLGSDTSVGILESPFEEAVLHGAHVSRGLTPDDIEQLVVTMAGTIPHAEIPPVVSFMHPADRPAHLETTVVYRMLLARCPVVLVLASEAASYSNWKVRGTTLPTERGLGGEGFMIALSPSFALVSCVSKQDPGGNLWDIAISQNPALARLLLRQTMDLIDTLPGGIRHSIESDGLPPTAPAAPAAP